MCRRESTSPVFIAVLTLSLALTASVAIAQQPKPADEPPPRLEGSAQAALLAITGNTSTQALGFGGDVVWRPLPWMLRAKAVFAQTETDDELSARSTVALFRTDRFLTSRTSLFGQYDFLRDLFAGVEQRSTIAGSVAYKLIPGPPHRLTIDGGLGFQHESRVDEESENNAIATAGVGYAWEFSETSRLVEDFRYIQGLNSLDNWKLDQSIALTAAIASAFSLKVSNIVRYANEPVLRFESTDIITRWRWCGRSSDQDPESRLSLRKAR